MQSEPPVARRDPMVRSTHGVDRTDHYGWMRDVGSDEVQTYLRSERGFYDHATRHLDPLTQTLFTEMSVRIPPTDRSVSWDRPRCVYYTVTPAGSEHPQLCRSSDQNRALGHADGRGGHDQLAEPTDVVLLDPAALADGSPYVELGVSAVSPDERLLAYSVDVTGAEAYELRFRDLDSLADLPDRVPGVPAGGAWAADSQTFFYLRMDDAYRAFQVWRHRLGTPVESDVLVFDEHDEQYEVGVRLCRSGEAVVVHTANRDTSEVWLLDAAHPEDEPRLVEGRRRGVEYSVEHVRGADAGSLLVVTNDGATEFRLMRAPLSSPGRDSWTELVPERSEERLSSVDAFAAHVVLGLRREGIPLLRILPLAPDGDPIGGEAGLAAAVEVKPSMPAGTVALGRNERYDADAVVVVEQSYTEPPCWQRVSLATGERVVVKRQETPGYDPAGYVSERIALASGGTLVPVTLVRRSDVSLDGTAPCLMYGYGAYEYSFEPEFDPALTAVLDRGVVFAHAHVRGGGERGRRWWLDGRLAQKQNTFSDHIAVAEALADRFVDGERIASRGLSAGGLLQGAVFSQQPSRWRAVVAEVPFVDVVTTMLDPSIPLTAGEWDEWGDPRREADFGWLLAYSPYDNIPAAEQRPDLLVTGALHDPRVMVWEPAKWVAALRASDPGWSPRCLFRVELGAGAHAGPVGRYARLRYEAEVYAWVLERLCEDADALAALGQPGRTTPR